MAPSGHRRNLHPVILAVLAIVVVPIKLVGPNTAVFGTVICIQKINNNKN